MNDKKRNILQALKFALVGACNTVIDYLLFFVFLSFLHCDKSIAQIFATSIAMANSYVVNRYWTFGQTGRVRGGEMWRFVVVNIVSMSVTILLLNLFYDGFHLENAANAILSAIGVSFRLSGDAAIMFCKLVAMPFSLMVNFFGNRLWVFGKKETKEQKE